MSTALELPLNTPTQDSAAPVEDDVRFDWINKYCRDKFGAPEGWRWYTWARKEFDQPHEFLLVEGAVCTVKKTRGKYKGADDWKQRDKSTDRTYSISRKDLHAFQVEWQTATGNCFECYGTGRDWAGWSAAHGTRYEPCRHCKATGRALTSHERRQTMNDDQFKTIVVNGEKITIAPETNFLSYEDVATLAGSPGSTDLTVVYTRPPRESFAHSGTLVPGRSIDIEDKMVFDAIRTGAA